jgi:hypothetical protein
MAIHSCSDVEISRVEEIFERIAGDLAMIIDREFTISSIEADSLDARPVGADEIHISFKLGFQMPDGILHGSLLVPLNDAICLSCYLMMVADDAVARKRGQTWLDNTTKDAMLEVGNFVAGATDAGLRALGVEGVEVGSEGCQGVRPDIRPALVYDEGQALIVGRAKATLHDFPEFEMLLILPDLGQ